MHRQIKGEQDGRAGRRREWKRGRAGECGRVSVGESEHVSGSTIVWASVVVWE